MTGFERRAGLQKLLLAQSMAQTILNDLAQIRPYTAGAPDPDAWLNEAIVSAKSLITDLENTHRWLGMDIEQESMEQGQNKGDAA